MAKRNKIEIVHDILKIINENNNSIKITPLLRKTNVSSASFKEYYNDLISKELINEKTNLKNGKIISLSEKGKEFLEKYKTIIDFIEEFEL